MFNIKMGSTVVSAATAKEALDTLRSHGHRLLAGQASQIKKLQAGESISLISASVSRGGFTLPSWDDVANRLKQRAKR
jgi:hypothetical protein